MNRRTLPTLFAVFAVFLTAFGLGTPSSSASSAAASASGVDPEVVAQSIAEDGYYIDSSAQYLRSDAAQDRLRSQLERSKSPVFVAVVPAGTTLSPVQVYRLAKRKGTYAVLTGGTLRAASNTLPTARVNNAVSQAVRTHRGDPGAAVVAFVGLTNGTSRAAATTRRRQRDAARDHRRPGRGAGGRGRLRGLSPRPRPEKVAGLSPEPAALRVRRGGQGGRLRL